MDFRLTREQDMLVEAVRSFVKKELLPREDDVDRTDVVSLELAVQIRGKVPAAGFYTFSMSEEVSGGGLDYLSQALIERELPKVSWVLHVFAARSSKIPMIYTGEQFGDYLLPYVQGGKTDCFTLTEPSAGSDVNSIRTCAVRDGGAFVVNGSKRFISHAGHADFAIVFAVTDSYEHNDCKRNAMTAFLVDRGMSGMTVRHGPKCVSGRGYHIYEVSFDDCRVSASRVLGEAGKGWGTVDIWPTAGRVMVAANCVGQAQRVLDLLLRWVADRKQFGQPIGSCQGVSFKLADMATQTCVAGLTIPHTAWKMNQSIMTNGEADMAKLSASKILGKVANEAMQIFGGMGLIDGRPIERIWRNTRIERIWEGTSEIQRYIVSREPLRPLLR